MVPIKAILAFGIATAIAIGSYAVYRNAGNIKSALSRGIEANITNPFSHYLDSISKNAQSNFVDSSTNTGNTSTTPAPASQQALKLARESGYAIAQARYITEYGQTIKTYQDALNVFKNQYDSFSKNEVAESLPSTYPDEEHRSANPSAPKNEPLFAPSPEGWYYRDFNSGRTDQQVRLKQGTADSLRRRGANLHFLTPSKKLSQRGFERYGRSKGFQ